jgi:hypothetical protein
VGIQKTTDLTRALHVENTEVTNKGGETFIKVPVNAVSKLLYIE